MELNPLPLCRTVPLTKHPARAWDQATALTIIDSHRAEPGALLPIFHALQDTFGYVDREALPLIAEALNISRAEVHGVMSFYHDFRDEPAGRTVIKICRAEACQSVGCQGLVDHVDARHGITLGETTADGAVTVEEVFCLGNCALGPSAMVDGKPLGRMTREKLDHLIAAARTGRQ